MYRSIVHIVDLGVGVAAVVLDVLADGYTFHFLIADVHGICGFVAKECDRGVHHYRRMIFIMLSAKLTVAFYLSCAFNFPRCVHLNRVVAHELIGGISSLPRCLVHQADLQNGQQIVFELLRQNHVSTYHLITYAGWIGLMRGTSAWHFECVDNPPLGTAMP